MLIVRCTKLQKLKSLGLYEGNLKKKLSPVTMVQITSLYADLKKKLLELYHRVRSVVSYQYVLPDIDDFNTSE
jgi:hypothetical protein